MRGALRPLAILTLSAAALPSWLAAQSDPTADAIEAALAAEIAEGTSAAPHDIDAPPASPAPEASASDSAVATVAEQAATASENLRAAIAAMAEASTGRTQVAALTRTVRAYEEGLAAVREALRNAGLTETTLRMRIEANRARVSQLLSVLTRMEQSQGPLQMLHPTGPLGTARSGMMIADVTPAIEAEAEALRAQLREIAQLRALQEEVRAQLTSGLSAAQEARSALSQAISERRDLPKRFTEDPAALQALLTSAETLETFAAGLIATSGDLAGAKPFVTAMGLLPLPVVGSLILAPYEADSAGVRRPGMTLATRPRALVSAPWPGTIRYVGPFLDYGNVIILEPGDGYLLVMAGLETIFSQTGRIVTAGEPLGLMGGDDLEASAPKSGAGAEGSETLYLELRMGAAAVTPTEWFAATASTGD